MTVGTDLRVARGNAWVTCPRPNPAARVRLFCLPYAGGGASAYRAWSAQASQAIEVCPIQLPGRENRLRERAHTRLAPLLAELVAAIYPYLDKPFALFGHSLGALIAFQLARQLRREYLIKPIYMFVSGRVAPQAVDDTPPTYLLSEDTFIAQLRTLNGTPESILRNTELMQMILPTLRADFAVNETYAYQDEAPLDAPISAFGGFDDPKASAADLEDWRRQTSSAFSLRMLPGDHFFLNANPAALLRAVEQDLAPLLFP